MHLSCAPTAGPAVVLTSEGVTDMADLAYILLTVAFFATVALVARRSGDRDAS